MTARGGVTLALLCSALAALVAIGLDASAHRRRRAREEATIAAVVRILPGNDLAIAGGARHLRFLSLEEPSAAFADLPAMLDADPAGGSIAPPAGAWVDMARTSRARSIERGP